MSDHDPQSFWRELKTLAIVAVALLTACSSAHATDRDCR